MNVGFLKISELDPSLVTLPIKFTHKEVSDAH